MAKIYKTKTSLRFRGENLDPKQITKALSIPPTACELKGDHVSIGKNGQYRIADMGMWRLETDFQFSENLDIQISNIFQKMTQNIVIWKRISQLYSGNLFVGLFLKNYNEGFSLSPHTLDSIAHRGLELDFDIYSAFLGPESNF